MHYFRSIHGAPTDPKWLVVARKAKVLPCHVAAVWWSLLDHASQNEDRGSFDGYDPESIAAFFGMETEEVEAVLSALHDKGLLENNRIVKWEKHQPKREREDDSAERVRVHRARKTADVTAHQDSNSGVTAVVTPRNATKRPVTHGNAIKTDRQTEKETDRKDRQTETGLLGELSSVSPVEKELGIPLPKGKTQADWLRTYCETYPEEPAELRRIMDAASEVRNKLGYLLGIAKERQRRREAGLPLERESDSPPPNTPPPPSRPTDGCAPAQRPAMTREEEIALMHRSIAATDAYYADLKAKGQLA